MSLYYRIRPPYELIVEGGRYYLVGDYVYEILFTKSVQIDVIKKICRREGVTDVELYRILRKDQVQVILKNFSSLDLLQICNYKFIDNNEGCDAYFTSMFDDLTIQKSLVDKHVVIIGVGGVGGEVSRHMAASGVTKLTLFDPDIVCRNNFNRQYLLQSKDIGQHKVYVIADLLMHTYPDLNVIPIPKKINKNVKIETIVNDHVDAIVCCADEFQIDVSIVASEFAKSHGAVFSMGAVGLTMGTWGPTVLPKFSPSFKQWCSRNNANAVGKDLSPMVQSFGPTNSLISSALSKDIIHVLVGLPAISLHTKIILDFESMQINKEEM